MADAGPSEFTPPVGRPLLFLGESRLVLPPTDPSLGSAIHSVTGRLRGRSSGRQWAFLLLFWLDGLSRSDRTDLRTLAFFDLDTGDYGTSTESKRRRRRGRGDPSPVAQGQFALSFLGPQGESTWRTHDGSDGALAAATSVLHAVAVDAASRVMKLDLEVEAKKPALPLGGHHRGGTTFTGPPGMRGNFQSGVRFSGRFEWGGEHEEVDGDGGWIAHRSASRVFGPHRRFRGARYAHEWRQIQLGDGTEISVWLHFDRERANRVIPPSIATAIGPSGEVTSITEFHLERLSFVRDPRGGAAACVSHGGKYFAGRYRLQVPAWSLDLLSEPLVEAPAHELPIAYWNGPTRLTGALDGLPVSGFGFDERTHALSRDFELVDVLRDTLRHLPPTAFAADRDAVMLADLAWEIEGFIAEDDPQGAIRHLNSEVRTAVDALAEPHRNHVVAIVDDTADALLRWWVRP